MSAGTSSERTMIFAIGFFDRQVVDAREAPPHEPGLVELPILVAVRAKPLTRVVVPFVGKANRYSIRSEYPELLYQPIVELPDPFASEEGDNLFAALQEFSTVSPARVHRIRECEPGRVARIPSIFGQSNLFYGAFAREPGGGEVVTT